MSQPTDPAPSPAPISSEPAQKPPRLALLIATGFGLGYLPKAPGTWGSLGGLLFLAAIPALNFVAAFLYNIYLSLFVEHRDSFDFLHSMTAFFPLTYGVTLAGTACIGVWAARRAADYLRQKDPAVVVIDEISGQLTALIPVGRISLSSPTYVLVDQLYGWKYLLAGLILFRVFDIWKPWPVRAAEKLPGGWGIMADDWVAGIYAALCLWALRAAGM